MAIYAYTGNPGAGKSYEVVNNPMLRAVAEGRPVWTNIPVNLPGPHVVKGDAANEHWYLDAPPGALVVIDEVWRYWPSGQKTSTVREDIREFLAMHRHRTSMGQSTDILIVCQDLSQVAAFVRDLVEKTFRMRKLSGLGTRSSYRVDVYRGAVRGARGRAEDHIAGWVTRYKPDGFKLYQSHTQGGDAKEIEVDKRGSVWRRPAVLAIPLALLAPVLVVWAFREAIPGGDIEGESVPVPEPAKAPALIAPPPRPQPTRQPQPAPETGPEREQTEIADTQPDEPEPPQDSTRWRLRGYVQRADGTGWAELESRGGRQRVSLDLCDIGATEPYCTYEGERIGRWTGRDWASYATGSYQQGEARTQ